MSDLEERYKTCGKCVHDGDGDPNINGSTCYLCRRNPTDHRIDCFEAKKEKETLRLEGRLLLFDTVNKNRDIFPKTCKIDIPKKVPLLWEFQHYGQTIGVAEISQDDKGLIVKAETFSNNFIGVESLRDVFTNGKIGVGGYYSRLKKHEDDGLIIVDECTLREVSITLAPVHEEYYLKIVED